MNKHGASVGLSLVIHARTFSEFHCDSSGHRLLHSVCVSSDSADWISGSVPFYEYIHIPFIVLFGLSIVAIWVRPKIGYIMGLISGVAGIAVLSPFTFVKGVSNPADFGLFFYVITIFPMMLAAVLYSLMAYLDLRNPNRPISSNRLYLRRLIIILILGFIIGGVTVGSFAAGTENQLLSSLSSSANITIPRGATVQGNTAYSPGNFTVKAGQAVSSVNNDTTAQ